MRDALAEPVRRRRDSAATRRAILEAARAMAAERGPEALTMSDVAHRAGVNRATLYQHFRTREGLIGAVIAGVSDQVTKLLASAAPEGGRIDFMLDFMLDHPEVGRLWIYGILSEIPIANRDGWERYLRGIEHLAAGDAAVEGIDAEMLAHVLQCAVLLWSVRAESRIDDPGERRAQTRRFARELNRLLRHGVLRRDGDGDGDGPTRGGDTAPEETEEGEAQ